MASAPADHVALAQTHRHDDLVGHAAGSRLADDGLGLLERRRGVGGAELDRLIALELHGVDGEDLAGPGQLRALHRIDADAADPDDRNVVPGRDLGRVDGGTPAGDDPAPEQAGLVQGDTRIDLDAAGLVDHRPLGERSEEAHETEVGAAGVMAGRVVGDLAAAAEVHAEVAEVLVTRRAGRAAPARRDETEDHMVARGQPVHAGPDLLDDARSLVASDDRQRERQVAGHEVLVGVAQPGADQPDEDLAVLGRVEVDLLDAPVLAYLPQDRCSGLHADLPRVSWRGVPGRHAGAVQRFLLPRAAGGVGGSAGPAGRRGRRVGGAGGAERSARSAGAERSARSAGRRPSSIARMSVTYEQRDGVAVVTFDDGKANVYSHEALGGLGDALDRASADPDARTR